MVPAGVGIFLAAPGDQECDQTQVRLGLAAPGGEPDEIQNIPKFVVFPNRGNHDGQQECQLKGTPAVVVELGLPAADTIGLVHLVEHRPIRQSERLGRQAIGAEHLDAPPHSIEGDAHPVADSFRRGPFVAVQKLGGDAFLPGNPVGVPVGEARQLVGHGRIGEARETEHRIVTAGVDGHHRHLRIGHEFGPDPRLTVRSHVPIRGRSMTDRIDVLFSVLKLELLFLPGEQTRIDSWILDEFAALHDACEPCLEQ